jgi:AcrR family transcriptional regulator
VDILDAAEKRLVSAGPSGIRLQEVARDVGMSHPTVLHHFGSREGLVQAVMKRALGRIHERLLEAGRSSTAGEGQIAAMLDAVFEALSEGHGRVLMWLALEGLPIEQAKVSLTDVVDALHEMRKSRASRAGPISRDDTAQAVVLAALALIGMTVLGPRLLEHTGLSGDAAGGARFRRWLAQLLAAHLDAIDLT